MSSRKEELLLAKKARLAELKRQREERQSQFATSKQRLGGEVALRYPVPHVQLLTLFDRLQYLASQQKSVGPRSTTSFPVWSIAPESLELHPQQEGAD